MATLFLTSRHTEDAQALWRATIERGWDVHRLATWRIPEELRSTPHTVLYVEALFGPRFERGRKGQKQADVLFDHP